MHENDAQVFADNPPSSMLHSPIDNKRQLLYIDGEVQDRDSLRYAYSDLYNEMLSGIRLAVATALWCRAMFR